MNVNIPHPSGNPSACRNLRNIPSSLTFRYPSANFLHPWYVNVNVSNRLHLPVNRLANSPDSSLEFEPGMKISHLCSAIGDLMISDHTVLNVLRALKKGRVVTDDDIRKIMLFIQCGLEGLCDLDS